MNYKNIPSELQSKKQWVLWEAGQSEDTGKVKKYPYQLTGEFASVANAVTWTSFNKAVEVRESEEYEGIGYVFADADSYIGIDFDKCIDENGHLNSTVLAIVERLNSYTEVSPSGTGIHVIAKGDISDFISGTGMKRDGVVCEIYTTRRYFTMTGNVILDKNEINDGEKVVKELVKEYYPEKLKSHVENAPQNNYPPLNVSKQRVLKKMFGSKYGKNIKALYNNELNPYTHKKSLSELDFSLCMQLAFWCRKDKVLIKEILMDSKLYREKWDRSNLEQHDYIDATIDAACEKQDKIYTRNY